jgi:hypothetical protein
MYVSPINEISRFDWYLGFGGEFWEARFDLISDFGGREMS